jgi:hypothetical protein
MDKEKESLLNLNFLQSEKFKPRDPEQLRRIEKKLLTLYELKHGNLNRKESIAKNTIVKESDSIFANKKKQLFDIVNVDRNFLKNEIKQNALFGILSLSSYIYFTRISKIFYRTQVIALFRSLFLFTFCMAPVIISLYFTKLNISLHKYESSSRFELI